MDRDGNREGGGFNIELHAPFQHFYVTQGFSFEMYNIRRLYSN